MELRKIDLCDYRFDEFILQIYNHKKYLVKIKNDWYTGKFIHSRKTSVGGFGWDIDIGGGCRISLGESSNTNTLNNDLKEIFEICDHDIIVENVRNLLSDKDNIVVIDDDLPF